jgi:hypothetical protein
VPTANPVDPGLPEWWTGAENSEHFSGKTLDGQKEVLMGHPAVDHVLKFFDYEHLPGYLQAIAQPVHDLAYQMADELLPSPEVTVGLRKLLEAKDCFVRARIDPLPLMQKQFQETIDKGPG